MIHKDWCEWHPKHQVCTCKPKALPPPDQDVAKGFVPPTDDAEAVKWLRQRVRHLEQQLDWKNTEYAKLQEIYTKLADCWNAFQATTKPIQRDVHRAEAAGEMGRVLAEMLIRLAYNTGGWQDLLVVLNRLSADDSAPRHAKALARSYEATGSKPQK